MTLSHLSFPLNFSKKIIFGNATISIKWFSASSFQTISFNGFFMVFWVILPFGSMVSMAIDHWSNDVMVSMDRSPLPKLFAKGGGDQGSAQKTGVFSNINTVFVVWSRRTPIDVNGFIVYICFCTFICYNLVIVYFHIKCNFCLCQLEQFNL